MINYTESNDYIFLNLNNKEQKYSIPISSIGDIEDWYLFQTPPFNKIKFPIVSRWVLHLATTRNLDEKTLSDLSDLIKKKNPKNKIDWEMTSKALTVYYEYRELTKDSENSDKKITAMSEGFEERITKKREVIKSLIEKYNLS